MEWLATDQPSELIHSIRASTIYQSSEGSTILFLLQPALNGFDELLLCLIKSGVDFDVVRYFGSICWRVDDVAVVVDPQSGQDFRPESKGTGCCHQQEWNACAPKVRFRPTMLAFELTAANKGP